MLVSEMLYRMKLNVSVKNTLEKLSALYLDEFPLSWDHFWGALRDYFGLFKRKKVTESGKMTQMKIGKEPLQQISQTELAGLIAWIHLAEVIAKHVSILFISSLVKCNFKLFILLELFSAVGIC